MTAEKQLAEWMDMEAMALLMVDRSAKMIRLLRTDLPVKKPKNKISPILEAKLLSKLNKTLLGGSRRSKIQTDGF